MIDIKYQHISFSEKKEWEPVRIQNQIHLK